MAYFIPVPITFSTIPCYLSQPFVSGFEQTQVGAAVINLAAGCARALTQDYVIKSLSPLSLDLAVTGPGGFYPFLPSTLGLVYNTVFGIYLCYDTTHTVLGPNPTLIGATGNEFLYPGYNTFVRVSLTYVNFNGLTYNSWVQSGSSNDRIYELDVPRFRITGGTSNTFAFVSLTNQNGIVPPKFGVNAKFSCRFQSANDGDILAMSYLGQNVANEANALQICPTVGAHMGTTFPMVCGQNTISGDSGFYYLVSPGASVQINNIGFTDNMGNFLF